MCGIWAILGQAKSLSATDRYALLNALRARGPEHHHLLELNESLSLGFTRLAINGLTSEGNQPFALGNIRVVCNGEIYNYRELADRHVMNLPKGTSDCAVIPRLFAAGLGMTEICRTLDGVFAFVLTTLDAVYVARDPYGVRPLFHGVFQEADAPYPTRVWSSEIKGLPRNCTKITTFPPGVWRKYSAQTGELLESQVYHTVPHVKLAAFEDEPTAQAALRTALTTAVKKRLMSDRPIGALLSGGVDSSLIAAIAAQELTKMGKRLTTFSIGMPGSTDLEFAQKVADHIGSIHHTIRVSPEDFLAALPKVIADIESYDITTVRASVGNWLLGKYIKENTDIKVVFNGDGSDEIGGGYLYFFAAPSDEAFEAESERLLSEIHIYDVLRSDRGMASHGLEARTPFLDKNVVATWRAQPTRFRRPILNVQVEKYILRAAFDHTRLLPPAVLWRKKEAFSDGVSAREDSWYMRCAEEAKKTGVTQSYVETMTRGGHNPPPSVEAYWYRTKFEELYGPQAAKVIPRMWMPRWIAGATDPSARTLKFIY